ncbi:MAG TPA: MobF family relaxase, partial [Candidatus Saccharimonadales bacterium]|nr:MobF family relaxase [Candidatus Saccharimonadales bacterium]
MNSYAELKDSEYCLRAVADLASQKELGLRRSVADNKIVAYRHADGRIVPAADVKAVSGTVKVPGLRLPDGRVFARDQVKSERERGLITGYRLPGGQLVSRALTQTIQIARRRVISYRFADGTEVPRGEVHAVTAAEAGNPFLDSTGAAVQREGVAALDQAGRVLGYYSLNGENPGEWYGKAVGMLGLTGHISLNENRATWSSLYQGRHPVTGKQLTRGQPRGDRIAGHDVVFSVPKSLSLAWADAETATERAEIERAVMTAARADWDYLEDQISFARRGHTSGGPNDPYPDTSYLERTMGLVGGMWLHRTARPTEGKPADPQLHVHMQILNMTPSEDGTWHALDTTAIRYYLMSAGYVGQAVLRHETSRADGCALEWTQPVKGQAEVRGLDSRALIESFSQRHEETLGAAAAAADKINSKRAEQGLEPVAMSSQEVMDLAAHETRQKKELSKPTEELVAEVRQRKAALGFGELHRTYPTQPPREAAMTSKVAERLARGITEELNVFSPKDVMMGVAGAFRQGAPLDRLEVMARELVEGRSEGVIPLGQHTELTKRDFVRRDDGRLVPVRAALEGDAAERYTTREIVSAERAVVGDVVKRRLAAVGTVPTAVVEEVITAYPTLTSDQQRAVRGLLTDGAGVSILKSPPGKGKSFVVRPIVEAYKTVGIPVIATAVVARRATKLGREAGVEQAHRLNVSKLRSQVEGWSSPGVPLPRGCVVIVDEAEVMDVRDRAALQAHVAAAAGKVVLVGDPRQIGSIGPTAPFRELTHIAPTYELTWNWRFKDKDEANAIDALHAGDVAAYLKWKESKGQVEYAEGDDLRQAKTTMIARAVAIFLEDRDR